MRDDLLKINLNSFAKFSKIDFLILLHNYKIVIKIPHNLCQLGYFLYQPALNLKNCKINLMETNQINFQVLLFIPAQDTFDILEYCSNHVMIK